MRIFVWVPQGSAVKRQFGPKHRILFTLLAYFRMTSARIATPNSRQHGWQTQPARPPTVLKRAVAKD